MNENGSMPTPRYIDIEAFKVSYKMAIYAGLEALKDKPIERDKAIAVMYTVFEALDAFPTATIESTRPDWTPCAEGLPTPDAEESGVLKRYLCTTSTPSGKFVVVELIYITIGEKPVWYDNDYYELFEGSGYQVMAWMPRPEPYNPDRKEDAKSDDVSQWPDWKKRAALCNYEFGKED